MGEFKEIKFVIIRIKASGKVRAMLQIFFENKQQRDVFVADPKNCVKIAEKQFIPKPHRHDFLALYPLPVKLSNNQANIPQDIRDGIVVHLKSHYPNGVVLPIETQERYAIHPKDRLARTILAITVENRPKEKQVLAHFEEGLGFEEKMEYVESKRKEPKQNLKPTVSNVKRFLNNYGLVLLMGLSLSGAYLYFGLSFTLLLVDSLIVAASIALKTLVQPNLVNACPETKPKNSVMMQLGEWGDYFLPFRHNFQAKCASESLKVPSASPCSRTSKKLIR